MKHIFTFVFLATTLAGPTARAHDVAEAMGEAANDFLASLTEEQRAETVYETDDPERVNWHFVPKPFEGEKARGGLPLKDMRADQRHLAYALLSTGMSHRGFATSLQIMSLEQVLHELENAPHRDAAMYYLTLFGEPGSQAWGWRVEGHHLSINFTVADGEVVSGTPNFFASNPAEVLRGPREGLRVLAAEEDVARGLVQSLSDEQREAAVVREKAPRDILTSADSEVSPLEDLGVRWKELNDAQRDALLRLIDVYVHRLRPDVAERDLAEIEEAGMEHIVFAWAGGMEKRQPHYYRVQGPTFLLEYANTQNDANHVHAVWRDFDGDFGRDHLREHYQAHHRAE